MNYNVDFNVKSGNIGDYRANADYGIEFVSDVDNRYSYLLYKTVVFLLDSNKAVISSGSVKKCLADYAYVMFWLEPVKDELRKECWDILELMTRQLEIKYAFFVVDSLLINDEDRQIISRGYEEFDGLDDELMADKLGARIIHDKSFRKQVVDDTLKTSHRWTIEN